MAKATKKRKPSPPRAAARRVQAPRPVGWRTTDADEIALRRERAVEHALKVRNVDAAHEVFSTFEVSSATGSSYLVDIRSLLEPNNSCSCPDFRTNGLGTCKHVEAVLTRVRRKRLAAAAKQSPRAEIFLRGGREPQVVLQRPMGKPLSAATRRLLDSYFDAEGVLRGDAAEVVPALARALGVEDTTVVAPREIASSASGARKRAAAARPTSRLTAVHEVRLAAEALRWAAERRRRVAREITRQNFMDDVRSGKRTLDVVKHPLYPYQVEGMLHLAFTERALLGDEMGLGKTVQAIAACALLRQLGQASRVLLVCPVSVKAEWEEQIAKFTDLPLQTVFGPKPTRSARYEKPPFFTIVNYEQAVSDLAAINGSLRPDIVILDEAQRIKNWSTKTARTLKRLESRYAFLLTGTPIENRIDEIYSIIEFLDPDVFGPLFRFNREFYDLDARGRPVGYLNLDEMQRRIRPLLLRRRKDEVEKQLPSRIDNNYFVPMSPEQTEMYEEYHTRVARLAAVAKRRPLTREEHEKLQRWLACMRMVCDTPHILSPQSRVCPKLGELEVILDDLDVRNGRKALIFSEWERMLELVRDLAREKKLPFAWHTGSVPQPRRREEIRRFKEDPACRLFLSTDCGSVGLNLQAASVVINLDLPWNPARLEQRIARAWRKHQTRKVHVVNLVSEGTIEHQMLGTLAAKKQLADALLDSRGDVATVRMPTAARQAFVDRLQALLTTPAKATPPTHEATDPIDMLRGACDDDLAARIVELRTIGRQSDGTATMLIVADGLSEEAQSSVLARWREVATGRELPSDAEIVDAATARVLERLARRGLVSSSTVASPLPPAPDPAVLRRRRAVESLSEEARRQMRMADLLRSGGFGGEAVQAARAGVEGSLRAVAVAFDLLSEDAPSPVPEAVLREEMVPRSLISLQEAKWVASLRGGEGDALPSDPAAIDALLTPCRALCERLQSAAQAKCG